MVPFARISLFFPTINESVAALAGFLAASRAHEAFGPQCICKSGFRAQ
jgi:hypothetical protein